ncbi:hypothetical protein WJX73_002829 [Symbiochloris irregularis]|uniref:PCI domain-containing protein n=1 Tax=Symbiochloris irregularis TaxID=706552 RepID=A0AAW1NZ54_9CHLO
MAGEAQLEEYVLLAKGTHGRATADLVVKATAAPGLFVFGELLDLPSVKQLKGTDQAVAFALLELFAYGTIQDYRGAPERYGQLSEPQVNKMKQLTAVSLAGESKMIAYATLMQQLSLSNIRELEDFVIGECFYAGIIKGKLDQQKQCLHVHDAISRDIAPAQLHSVLHGLKCWHKQTVDVLTAIEDRKAWTQQETALAEKLQAQMEQRMELVRKGSKAEAPSDLMAMDAEPMGPDLMEHDRSTGARPKRRR